MESLDGRLEVDAFKINKNENKVEVFGRNNRFLYHIVNDIKTGKNISEETIARPFWYKFPKDWDFGYDTYSSSRQRFALWYTSGVRKSAWSDIYKLIGKKSLLDEILNYEYKVCEIRRKEYNDCITELKKSVENVRLYQGSIDEVSKQVGKKLEMVNLGTAETFIEFDKDYGYVRVQEESIGPFTSDFMLRLKVKEIGADAVVHYIPGSSIGTPVRFVDKK